MATEEDAFWETGKCSGTMYCGDHEHYEFMGEAFQLFAHANILQRDMFPSATKLEGEIIAMTMDLMHGDAAEGGDAVGMVTTGGTGSIMHAILAYREHGRKERGIERPNIIKPETAHAAFDKAAHLFDLELRRAPVDPETTKVRPEVVADLIDDSTVAVIGSACNYGYGTVDPIAELGALAQERGIGLHVDGCLGGFILPWGEQLGYPVPPFDFRVPGVTSISADTHKYAYGLKGTSVLLFRDRALRNSQYFFLTDWTGGKYCSPGMEGSRSGGLLAATWAGMLKLGRGGYLRYAQQIFETVRRHAGRGQLATRSCGCWGRTRPSCSRSPPTSSTCTTSTTSCGTRGWRFNGQQYPNALHMAVTRPQTQAGVVDAFATDLAEAVAYAAAQGDEPPKSGAIYGGIPGGMTPDADEFIRAVMTDMMDDQQALPPE